MANSSMDRDLVAWLRQQLLEADPDLLRELLATMVQELMGAEAQQACGAEYGEHSSERSNSRNGYREQDWDTHAGIMPWPSPVCGHPLLIWRSPRVVCGTCGSARSQHHLGKCLSSLPHRAFRSVPRQTSLQNVSLPDIPQPRSGLTDPT